MGRTVKHPQGMLQLVAAWSDHWIIRSHTAQCRRQFGGVHTDSHTIRPSRRQRAISNLNYMDELHLSRMQRLIVQYLRERPQGAYNYELSRDCCLRYSPRIMELRRKGIDIRIDFKNHYIIPRVETKTTWDDMKKKLELLKAQEALKKYETK